jgi:hypothetical protein
MRYTYIVTISDIVTTIYVYRRAAKHILPKNSYRSKGTEYVALKFPQDQRPESVHCFLLAIALGYYLAPPPVLPSSAVDAALEDTGISDCGLTIAASRVLTNCPFLRVHLSSPSLAIEAVPRTIW